MRLGVWLGKPTQLRALLPIAAAASARGWGLTWDGPDQFRPSGAHAPRWLPDVTVSVDPPKTPSPWIWLQAGMDPFSDPALPGTDATVAVYTDWWLSQLPAGVRGVSVGMPVTPTQPQNEASNKLVYVPFSVRSGSPSWRQRVINTYRHRQFLRHLFHYRLDNVFADLVVKTRVKDPLPRYLRSRCEQVGDAHGDSLWWLDGVQGVIHMYSSVVLEAAALGVPSLCFDPGPGAFRPGTERFCHGRLGGLFNWPGVARWRPMLPDPFAPWPDVDYFYYLSEYGERRRHRPMHSEFHVEHDALRRYRETYVGDTQRAADNVCDLAESMK